MNKEALSVSELNNCAKNLLENHFFSVFVKGEIGNFTAHSSGHWYFSIKDAKSSLDCVMFAGANARYKRPQIGEQVLLGGKISLYAPSARFQLICNSLESLNSLGDSQIALRKLYQKLKNEGVFEQNTTLPKNFHNIAIITAKNSAAMNDMLRIIENKAAFLTNFFILDCLMQGENAAKNIAKNIKFLNFLNETRRLNLDAIIIARGGGSKEDLFVFNDELLARSIAASKISIITGIGHEIDLHLSDFAASKHCSTPTAAMEFVCYDASERMIFLDEMQARIKNSMQQRLEKMREKIEFLEKIFNKNNFKKQLFNANLKLKNYETKLKNYEKRFAFYLEKLSQKEKILHFTCENRLKNEEKRLKNYENILQNQKTFFDSLENYAKIQKNQKLSKLQDLKSGDVITLSNAHCEKQAKIL